MKRILMILLCFVMCFSCGCSDRKDKTAENSGSNVCSIFSETSDVKGVEDQSSKETTTSKTNTSNENTSKNNASKNNASSREETISTNSDFILDYDQSEINSDIEITNIYEYSDAFETDNYEQKVYIDSYSGNMLPYCIFEPKKNSPDKGYPVLLFLHGAGETGTDNVRQVYNLEQLFVSNGDLLKDTIILCPQTTSWWNIDISYGDRKGNLSDAVRLIDDIAKRYPVDKDRIYVIGLSMGGYGTWSALSYYPEKFAAGVPICGGGNTSFARTLAEIPIWIYHGTQDPTVSIRNSEDMYNAIKQVGGKKIHFTAVPECGHNSWDPAMQDRELVSWLISQSKSKNTTDNYEVVPRIRLENSDGKVILTDSDTNSQNIIYYFDKTVWIRLKLTPEGKNKLKEAYENGGEFTFYHGGQKIFSFVPINTNPDKYFLAEIIPK